MFWSGNYTAVRELNFLLKEENVSLTQVLEADDILQECKGDNKALIQFLTKPEVLAELITLITEEPSKNVELASQYRHASIACEVLTSQLSMLSDRLSLDTVQMNRLCDFINREPPLNPLLASYFSKTVEMLLERSPKQDWYLYHIVCLRVLDFFKSRRDFLPNLLRHLATSAIADTFKYFIRLEDLFNKIVMEWLEEHQFLESLIQIICGTYAAEAPAPAGPGPSPSPSPPSRPEKGEREHSEKLNCNHTGAEGEGEGAANNNEASPAAELARPASDAERRRRSEAVASANAAGLLCDLVLNGCADDACTARARTGWALVERLAGEDAVRRLLQGMFTAPPAARAAAVVHGCGVLLALLQHSPARAGVERAVAPHLPLLHQALLQEPASAAGGVGAARVQVAALLAALAASPAEDVCATMLTLGTPGALLDLFLRHPNNNFLHAQVYAFVCNAMDNRKYRTEYAQHLVAECLILSRLMAVYEKNQSKRPRDGHAGHVTLVLARLGRVLVPPCDVKLDDGDYVRLCDAYAEYNPFAIFICNKLNPMLRRRDTPLGGYYPSENIYEESTVDESADTMAASYDDDCFPSKIFYEIYDTPDTLAASYDPAGLPDAEGGEGVHFEAFEDDNDKVMVAKNSFLKLSTRRFDDDTWWADGPDADADADAEEDADADGEAEAELGGAPLSRHREVLAEVSPWEAGGSDAPSGGEGWAQFGGDAFPPPVDPFAPRAGGPDGTEGPAPLQEFSPYWPAAEGGPAAEAGSEQLDIAEGVRSLQLEQFSSEQERSAAAELASNLLSAMSGMAPDLIANIVNANISPLHLPPAPPAPPSPPPPAPPAPEAPSDEADDKTSYESSDKLGDRSSDKPSDKSGDKPSDKSCDKPSDKSNDKFSDKPSDKSSDEPSDEPSDKPSDEPSDKPNDEPSDKASDEPSDDKSTDS